MIKNIITFVFIVISTSILSAQRGQGRGMGKNQGGQQGVEMQKFDAVSAAGIHLFDADILIKKLKIKAVSKTYNFTKAIDSYNDAISEIKFANSQTLKDITVIVNTRRKEAMKQHNMELMKEIKMSFRKALKPIRNQVQKESIQLNNKLSSILSEKQFKKWQKYQKKIKRALNPKDNPNKSSSGQHQGQGKHKKQGGFMH